MEDITQAQFCSAVLNVTAGPDWDVVKKGLENDVYQVQASALDAKSWDEVCVARGFAQGLAYMINLREATKAILLAEVNNNADI